MNICRVELFKEWFVWGVKYKDIDPAVWMTEYLNSRFEHNIEQRYWFCWLYANTYNLPTAWVLFQEFPDFELVTVSRLEKWHEKNYKLLRYQVDTKWNKGHLVTMFKSYKSFIGDMSQDQRFKSICNGSEEHNFDLLYAKIIKDLHKFGRYSTWFYLQHLKHTVGLNISPSKLILGDFLGSRSHRNGLLYALGLDHLLDTKLSHNEYENLEIQAKDILIQCKKLLPDNKKVDLFYMETALCSFKKIFRSKQGRYLGYYLDRQSEEISKSELDGWYGIDWGVLWQARSEMVDDRLLNKNINKSLYNNFLDTNNIYHNEIEWSKLHA